MELYARRVVLLPLKFDTKGSACVQLRDVSPIGRLSSTSAIRPSAEDEVISECAVASGQIVMTASTAAVQAAVQTAPAESRSARK